MFDFKDDPMSAIIMIVLIAGVAIGIYYAVVRWVFAINKQLDNQEKQIKLLQKIADKLGANETSP